MLKILDKSFVIVYNNYNDEDIQGIKLITPMKNFNKIENVLSP
jgi:hypothetical protein